MVCVVNTIVEQAAEFLGVAVSLLRNENGNRKERPEGSNGNTAAAVTAVPSLASANKLCSIANEIHRAAQLAVEENELTNEDEHSPPHSSKGEHHEFDLDHNLAHIKNEIDRLHETVTQQLSIRKHQANSRTRTKLSDIRAVDEQNAVEVAKKALSFCSSQIMTCCGEIEIRSSSSLEMEAVNSNVETADDDDEDQSLRNPIAADISPSFPFQHLDATDIATSSSAIWDWLLYSLPTSSVNGVGVFYSLADLRQMLLKCVVCAQDNLENPSVQLVHLTRSCMSQLALKNGGVPPQENDVLRCVADAFTTLFLYTVNLDGHFADPTTKQPLSVEKSLDLLKTIEWPRQKGDKSGPKLPDEAVALKVPSASKAPPNSKASGYNPAIWAVMNWTLRVGGDPAATAAVRKEARHGAHTFRFFAEHLVWALGLLPSTHCTVYRGIKGRTTRPYVQNTTVAWPAFSSTSTKDKEALGFMGKDRGTFFIVHCNTARDVAFASWYPLQAELLLPPSRQFKVQSRVSDTVLTMLESNVEFIVMREQRGAAQQSDVVATDEENNAVADQAIDAIGRTVFIYDAFVKKYVLGRFTTKKGSVDEENVVGVDTVAGMLTGAVTAAASSSHRRGKIIVGDGGSGKTSAMLFLLYSIATSTLQQTIPVFVSLPALKLWNHELQTPISAPIDAFICSALGLETPEQLAVVAQKRRLVILLDSLDEVSQEHRRCLHNCTSSNPLLHAHATNIVVSTRSEALQDARKMMDGSASSTTTLYCLPFRSQDARTMLVSANNNSKKKMKDEVCEHHHHIDALWQQLQTWRVIPVLSNPFVASMCIETLLDNASSLTAAHKTLAEDSWQSMNETTVYEAYLANRLSSSVSGGNGDSDIGSRQPRFQQATNIACRLTSLLTSHATIEQLGTDTHHVSAILRYESLEPTSSASFRHKSLQEYLVARAICCELYATKGLVSSSSGMSLLQSLPRVSRHFPNAIRLTASILQGNASTFRIAVDSLSKAVVVPSRSGGTRQDSLAVGTALSILVRTGLPLANLLQSSSSTSDAIGLEGVALEGAHLDGACFAHLNMKHTTIKDCILSNADFSGADMSGAVISNTELGELPTFKGHGNRCVVCVAFSPDGNLLASGSNKVMIHRADTAERVWTFAVHDDEVMSVAFSPNGQFVASSGQEGIVAVHQVHNGECVSLFKGHTKAVNSVAFSPDNKCVASASFDGTVRIHEITTGDEVTTFSDHNTSVTCVVFAPNGETLASGNRDGNIRLHQWRRNGRVLVPKEHQTKLVIDADEERITSVSFSPNGKFLVCGSSDVKVFFLGGSGGAEQIQRIVSHNDAVTAVSVSPDGKHIASSSYDQTVRIHKLDTGEEVRTYAGHSDEVHGVAFSPDGNLLVSGSSDTTVKTFRALNDDIDTTHSVFAGHHSPVGAVAFSPNGTLVASGSNDGDILLHHVETGNEIAAFSAFSHDSGGCRVRGVAFSPDGCHIASGTENAVQVHCVKTGRCVSCFSGHADTVTSITFAPNGTHIASSSFDKTVKVHAIYQADHEDYESNVKSKAPSSDAGEELSSYGGHENFVNAVAYSPNGELLVSGGFNPLVRIHHADSGQEVAALAGHTYVVNAVAFSPNGEHVASAGGDEVVRVHSVDTKAEVWRFSGHSNFISSVVFSPDGNLVASGSEDKTIKVHRALTGEEVSTFDGHTSNVTSVAFSPGGKMIVSGSRDKSVRIHCVDSGRDVLIISKMRQGRFDRLAAKSGAIDKSASDANAVALLKASVAA